MKNGRVKKTTLNLRRMGIDTYKEAILYMNKNCDVCLSEGFESQARVKIKHGKNSIIATLNIVQSDLLKLSEAGLSEHAWKLLGGKEGDKVSVVHAKPIPSFNYVHDKIYGKRLNEKQISSIIKDIAADKYSDIHISSFLTACAGGRLSKKEIVYLTKTMVDIGDRLSWKPKIIVDKHCVGGLPGNRTTPIIVAIISAYGLKIPKTSSRAITSPAGTADTMEVLAPVKIDIKQMRDIVDKHGGCVAWGGAVSLSPADDILIRIEKVLNLDSEGQLVASILSKKISAGSNHILIDIPIGKTAKISSQESAEILKEYLEYTGKSLGVKVKAVFSDGSQPVGKGIGPALEARDIVSVLRRDKGYPEDLRRQSLRLAGKIIEFMPDIKEGEGLKIATEILDSGKAWEKFQAICEAQGGMREIHKAQFTYPYVAKKGGTITDIDNRNLALIAKLAGAPREKTAGIDFHVKRGDKVHKDEKLFTIHSNSSGELHYVLNYLRKGIKIIEIS